MALSEYQWFDRNQPQTLQYGVIMLYVNAVFLLIFGIIGITSLYLLIGLALVVCLVAGALGIANERKWGYVVGVAGAFALLAYTLFIIIYFSVNTYVLNLIFDIAVVCLLLHPQSQDYRRIWFK
jgi:predicted membrane protein